MTHKMIYPIRWRECHPEGMRMTSDTYFADIADEVVEVLCSSKAMDQYDIDELCQISIRLTQWFEDLCSELGFWTAFNRICKQRYGYLLPFYDCENYCEGEPNPEDVWFLLWDSLQALNEDSFLNPENVNIIELGNRIFNIFADEWESAESSNALKQYLSDPVATTDYWKMRDVLQWIALHSYVGWRSRIFLEDDIAGLYEQELKGEMLDFGLYMLKIEYMFRNSHLLLSMSAPEWLSAVTGRKINIDLSLFNHRMYHVVSINDTVVMLHDMINEHEIEVMAESFRSINNLKKDVDGNHPIYAMIVGVNDKYYQIGFMSIEKDENIAKKRIEEIKEKDYIKSLTNSNYEHFYTKSGGKHILFAKGEKEIMKYYESDGITIDKQNRQQIKDMLRDQTEDGMVAFMATHRDGALTITGNIPAIKAPNNPYYDQEYARQHAANFLLDEDSIDYEAVKLLFDEGMLTDAALKSTKGYEYGRQQLQNNAHFIIDYSFALHE